MRDDNNSYYRDPEFLNSLHRWEVIEKEGWVGYMDAEELADVADYYYINHKRIHGDRLVDYALQLHPTSALILVFMARRRLLQHRFDEAAELLDKADEQDYIELIYLRAELLANAGKHKEADALLQDHIPERDAYDEDGESENRERLSEYLREVIGLWLDYDNVGLAAEWCDRLRREFRHLTPKDNILLADVANAMGQTKTAHHLLQSVIEKEPYNIEAWNMLAEVYFDEENYTEAADACETVLAVDEENYQAYITLVRVHWATENVDEVFRLCRDARMTWFEDEIIPLYQGMALSAQYSQQEVADERLLSRAYSCIETAERNSDGQSVEQANILFSMLYVCGEYYFRSTDERTKQMYKERFLDRLQQMCDLGHLHTLNIFHLSNMLIDMGEKELADQLLSGEYCDHSNKK